MGIDTRITPALHPQSVASMEDFDDDTAGELQQVVDAFTQAYTVIGQIHDARDAAEGDMTLTPAARVLQTSDVANKVMERATRAFDKVAANMRSGVALVQKELTAPVQARAAHTIAQEIRAYARSLKDQGKSVAGFVTEAIARGDEDSVTAILGAPSYLSGIDDKTQAVLLRMYHEKQNPVAAKRLRAMQAAADMVDRTSPLILKSIVEAVGHYVDPKTKRKIYPDELRKMKQSSAKAFAQLGEGV